MRNLSRLAALGLLSITAGCRAGAHQNVPLPAQDVSITRADVARIYFVREDGDRRQGVKVFDGETEIGVLTPDTFLCWERPGGRTLGRAFYEAIDPTRGGIEGISDLDCPAGVASYFSVRVARGEGKPTVVALAPEEGRRLVAERRPAAAR